MLLNPKVEGSNPRVGSTEASRKAPLSGGASFIGWKSDGKGGNRRGNKRRSYEPGRGVLNAESSALSDREDRRDTENSAAGERVQFGAGRALGGRLRSSARKAGR